MKDLYKSVEWNSLEEIDRAQLLLVIEGLKRGTIIGGNWTSFMDVLKHTGLKYELNTDKYRLNPVAVVAKYGDLFESHRQYLNLPESAVDDEYHRIMGRFLSYPECCTNEYVKERTPEQTIAKTRGLDHLTHKFGQELSARIMTQGKCPDVLDYRPPSFTPCGIDCPEAISVLESWKQAIDTLDPEAGRELVYFNRRDFPERLVHEDYLVHERERRNLEHRIKSLKSA